MQSVVAVGARGVRGRGGTGVSTYASTLSDALQSCGADVGFAGGTDLQRHPHALKNKLLRFLVSLKGQQRLTFSQAEHSWGVSDFFRKIQVHFSTFGRLTSVRSAYTPDIVHWSYPFPVYWEDIPNIYTIHDLIPLLHPELTGIQSDRMRKILRQCMQHAAAIITVSDAVQQDIAALFPEYSHKVVVLGQAVSVSCNQKMQNFSSDEYEKYFLYFGSIEKRKNIARLIEAHGQSGTSRPLRLLGNNGFGAREELAALERHPRPALVQQVAWCERECLLAQVQNACAVLFPSLAEGFGLPIVESMALGTPVMTSDRHATKEIAGQAALLVDPYNISEMAEAISLLDQNVEVRRDLAVRGLMRAQAFSMDSYARCVAGFYETLRGEQSP
ncbi:glycosyltransferase [Acetobacter orientalis]|uniref:glycosyltransferase n=1 Tax=Acetobacter orientalis TaxID=146474 RepID=UPI000A031354|nr:glycosyltransferase [Acetobacter orientalis]